MPSPLTGTNEEERIVLRYRPSIFILCVSRCDGKYNRNGLLMQISNFRSVKLWDTKGKMDIHSVFFLRAPPPAPWLLPFSCVSLLTAAVAIDNLAVFFLRDAHSEKTTISHTLLNRSKLHRNKTSMFVM